MSHCPHCRAAVSAEARYCVHCMRELEPKIQLTVKYRRPWKRWLTRSLWLVLSVAVAVGGIWLWPESPPLPVTGEPGGISTTTTATTATTTTTTTTSSTTKKTTVTTKATTAPAPITVLGNSGETWHFIPSTGTLTVRGEGDVDAFTEFTFDITTVRTLVLEEGIVAMNMCFTDFINLQKIVLPSTIKDIKGGFADGCAHLTEVNFPTGLRSIGIYAFRGTSLAKINLPETLVFIEWAAFAGCINLTEVVIPDSVTEIGQEAFSGCINLQQITLGKELVDIEDKAFHMCKNLKKVINRSALPIERGVEGYGGVGYYAEEIVRE